MMSSIKQAVAYCFAVNDTEVDELYLGHDFALPVEMQRVLQPSSWRDQAVDSELALVALDEHEMALS